VGLALGAGAAGLTTRLWPVAPRTAAEVRRVSTPVLLDERMAEDGTGVVIVANPDAGPALGRNLADQVRDALPGATLLELGEDLDIDTALDKAAAEGRVIGVVGGDGSVNAAAGIASRAGLPLLVVPGGTLNHFARDLGVQGVDDAVAALRDGAAVRVDLGLIADRPFVNTASFGSYSELVDARERLEGTIGKWPALLVALARVLRRAQPCEVELDGRTRPVWMVFIGNCVYHPAGFAPAWRERLDDGKLDIRLVDATHPWARTRLLLAVLTGRLGRSTVYETFTTSRLRVRSRSGPMRLARDGETFDGPAEFDIAKSSTGLVVLVPAP
jgi:undecaprenyl-diphosphatase